MHLSRHSAIVFYRSVVVVGSTVQYFSERSSAGFDSHQMTLLTLDATLLPPTNQPWRESTRQRYDGLRSSFIQLTRIHKMSLAFSASRTPMTTSPTARRVSAVSISGSPSLWLPSPRGRPALEVSFDRPEKSWQHLYVLPVLLLEFLAIALTRAVLPALLLEEYGDRIYLVMGFADFVKGLLAFFTCPLFGRASDIIGRRLCLFITVMGTCAPICTLALFHWNKSTLEEEDLATPLEDGAEEAHGFPVLWPFGAAGNSPSTSQHPYAITVFVALLSLSGVFSSTFPLVFAYISDTVKEQEERVSAYGLALATFGLSFTLGPMIGMCERLPRCYCISHNRVLTHDRRLLGEN